MEPDLRLMPPSLETSLGYHGNARWIFWVYDEGAVRFEIGDKDRMWQGNADAWEIFCTCGVLQNDQRLADASPGSLPIASTDCGQPLSPARSPIITLNGAYLLDREQRRLYRADEELIYRCLSNSALLQTLSDFYLPDRQKSERQFQKHSQSNNILSLPFFQTAFIIGVTLICCMGFGNPFSGSQSTTDRPAGQRVSSPAR